MGRLLRSELPDGCFHVTARAVADTSLYRDDDDRRYFLCLLVEAVDRFGWHCHAFCLMTTHYHFVVESACSDLSAGLHRLNGRYALGFNHRHGRFGHLFAERFSSFAIESEDYLYGACNYVIENPVRAGLCETPEDWPWGASRYGSSA
jgi:putative transposase